MTSSPDMNHMNFIDAVAASDTQVLRFKEASYKGSWKATGGRSAWMQFERNMTRLQNMLAKPEKPHGWSMEDLDDLLSGEPGDRTLDSSILQYLRDSYVSENIFHAIRQNPSGKDGTPLAALRDLRRYALLIEAEMISRGVCGVEQVGVTAGEGRVTFKAVTLNPAQDDGTGHLGMQPTMSEAMAEAFVETEGYTEHQDPSKRVVHATAITHEHTENLPEQQRTPEAVAPEAGLAPWVIGIAWRTRQGYDIDTPPERMRAFETYFKQQAYKLWVMEAAVLVEDNPPPLPIIAHLYLTIGGYRVVNIDRVPADAREFFPCLPREMNTVTRDESPAWQREMYDWSEGETKWKLRFSFMAWADRAD